MAEFIVALPTEKVPLEQMCFPTDKITGELIRCKDCNWYDSYFSLCNNTAGYPLPREQTFFCADGKRKE